MKSPTKFSNAFPTASEKYPYCRSFARIQNADFLDGAARVQQGGGRHNSRDRNQSYYQCRIHGKIERELVDYLDC